MATTIDTRANVKTRLGISGSTDDALLDLLLETADKQITDHVGGRTFPASPAAITEYHPGGIIYLQVRRPPIASVTSIKVDSTYVWTGITSLVENTDFRVVSSAAGIVASLNGQWLNRNLARESPKALDSLPHWTDSPGVVEIKYSGDGPADDQVKQAFALQVLHHYQIMKREVAAGYKDFAFQSDGTNQYQRSKQSEADLLATAGMPAIVQALLARYRIRPL